MDIIRSIATQAIVQGWLGKNLIFSLLSSRGLLLLSRRLNGLDGWVLVLGSDLDGTLWLGLDERDGIGEVLGWSLSSFGVEGLHAEGSVGSPEELHCELTS